MGKKKRDENNLTPLISKLKCSEVFHKTLVVYDISEKMYDPVPKLAFYNLHGLCVRIRSGNLRVLCLMIYPV